MRIDAGSVWILLMLFRRLVGRPRLSFDFLPGLVCRIWLFTKPSLRQRSYLFSENSKNEQVIMVRSSRFCILLIPGSTYQSKRAGTERVTSPWAIQRDLKGPLVEAKGFSQKPRKFVRNTRWLSLPLEDTWSAFLTRSRDSRRWRYSLRTTSTPFTRHWQRVLHWLSFYPSKSIEEILRIRSPSWYIFLME